MLKDELFKLLSILNSLLIFNEKKGEINAKIVNKYKDLLTIFPIFPSGIIKVIIDERNNMQNRR